MFSYKNKLFETEKKKAEAVISDRRNAKRPLHAQTVSASQGSMRPEMACRVLPLAPQAAESNEGAILRSRDAVGFFFFFLGGGGVVWFFFCFW